MDGAGGLKSGKETVSSVGHDVEAGCFIVTCADSEDVLKALGPDSPIKVEDKFRWGDELFEGKVLGVGVLSLFAIRRLLCKSSVVSCQCSGAVKLSFLDGLQCIDVIS